MPTAVLLMTMGDPPDLASVFPYMMKLFTDPLIIRAPSPVRYPLALYISLMKLDPVKAKYVAIGGGSPMNATTARQAELLEAALKARGDFRVYVANRYCAPSTAEAYKKIKEDGAKKVIALPLYPHYSQAVTGSSFKELEKLLERDMDAPEVVWIRSVSTDPGFIAAQAAKIRQALEEFPERERASVPVVFSAHSLPHEFIRQGDPYLDEIMHAVSALSGFLGLADMHVGFQSKGRKNIEWLRPETDDVLRELRAKGHENVLLVPVSFVSENIETLYDCDVLYRDLAQNLGFRKFVRARCMGEDPAFIAALAGIALDSLG